MEKTTLERIKPIYGILLFITMVISLLTMSSHPRLSRTLDLIIWGLFLVDTIRRMKRSRHPLLFIKEHPFDMLALIPIYDGFRFFKFVPIIASFVRFSTVGRRYILPFVKRLNTTGIGRIALYFMLIFFILPIPLVFIEPQMHHSYGTVLWWALQTVTTVGYGDIVPVTMLGKLIASILMILGVGMISALTSSLTSALGTQPIFNIKHKEKEEHFQKTEEQSLETILEEMDIEDIEHLEQIIQVIKKLKTEKEG